MPLRLHGRQGDFEARFAAFLADKRETAADVGQLVAEILAQVKSRGDAALLDYTRKFDRVDFAVDDLRLPVAAVELRSMVTTLVRAALVVVATCVSLLGKERI